MITCIDHEQTKRVLRNIMENSMKYRCREQVLIRMNLIPNKESVILKITDDGEGVPGKNCRIYLNSSIVEMRQETAGLTETDSDCT